MDTPPNWAAKIPDARAKDFFFLPAFIGAVVSLGLIRINTLMFFFLVPLGVAAYGYTFRTAWTSALFVTLGNILFSLGFVLLKGGAWKGAVWDAAFFTLMITAFTWIAAPPFRNFRLLRISTAGRLITASVLCTLSFLALLYLAQDTAAFHVFLKAQADLISSIYTASAGADVVQRTLLEQYLSGDRILEMLKAAALRGGGTASCIFLFFMNRQISLVLTKIFRHTKPGKTMVQFRTSPRLIWILSFVLLGILITIQARMTVPEIVLWNMLTICLILYLAQGLGVLRYLLAKAALPPFARFGLHVVFVLLFFSPGINAAVLGIVILFGIAENWVPFRTPKATTPP
jgi:hypothetical protein